jgi:ribonuclease D
MSETTPEDPVAVPLLAPAQGVPEVIDTPEKFESALVELEQRHRPLRRRCRTSIRL